MRPSGIGWRRSFGWRRRKPRNDEESSRFSGVFRHMATPSLHPLLHYLRRLSGGMAGDVEDAQLLRRFLTQRDESAFTAIVQRYGAMVWALCVRRLGETPEAEDAFQATFFVLVRKARSLHGPEP